VLQGGGVAGIEGKKGGLANLLAAGNTMNGDSGSSRCG